MKITESMEDYLKTILILKERSGAVRCVDIANELNFARSSVSVAIKKLRENGYIRIDGDGYIFLERQGLEIASRVFERHRTLTRFFTSNGVAQETAEKDACRLEHIMSEDGYRCMKSLSNGNAQN